MKLTNTSISNIKIENTTDTTVVAPVTAAPIGTKIKMSIVNTYTIMCPPIILANRRTVNAAGLVNIPKISIMGMIGNGNLSHKGTSGQNISFQ